MTMNDKQSQLVRTARVTGIWYLLLAVTGLLGFLIYHTQIFDPESSEKTLANLTDKESLARVRLLFEFGIVVSQAVAAVWFYRLFKSINDWAAWALGIWGMVNAVAIMISAISMASAIEIAAHSTQSMESKLIIIELLRGLIKDAWGVGSLFFGLWLIPMGYIVTSSRRMPVWLGRVLIIGGAGYLLNVVLNYSGVGSSWREFLVIPATIGEFWMIGYLLIFGIRPEEE
ncbi:MAG: DUF4386 domain-containing protein [Cyclobacteriaceae bacterium]|nr:DUF4386 domain-containing protein [Cyclobacteriaceae bacterium SS2]